MLRRWAGPLIAVMILGGVMLIVVLNLNLNGPSPTSPTQAGASAPPPPAPGSFKPAGFREYPIGEAFEKNQIRVSAVWLPPIHMDGQLDAPGADLIHVEADVKATEGNRNGFGKDEFVPYLKIQYQVIAADGGPAIHEGELMPMVASDGLHYGASIAMPRAGKYRLIYDVKPPSAGPCGLGRHSDPVTGVAPWWEPFQVVFDWDYPGPPKTGA